MRGIPKINAFDNIFCRCLLYLAILNQVWNLHSVTALILDGQIKREPGFPFYKMTDGRTSPHRNYIISTSMSGNRLVRS